MHKHHSLVSLLLATALLVSCGGGGSGGDGSGSVATTQQPATVGLVITDASIEDWDQALATITSIELIGDESPYTLFTGSETVDLLRLRDFVEVFAIDEGVRPGTYSKIRLRLAGLRLVRLNDDGSVAESRAADLVANGKIDLNPRDSFEIAPGAVLFITLDFDMAKSFKLTETGNGRLKVRPVIFVHIGIEPGFRNLARVQGTIAKLSDSYNGFLLCETGLVADPLSASDRDNDGDSDDDSDDSRGNRCVRVATDDETGLFGIDGLPADPMSLMVGDAVTVIGRLGRRMDYPEVEPLSNDADANDDEYDDDDDSQRDPVVLNAFTIEAGVPGTWDRIGGTVAEENNGDDLFELATAPAQGFAPDTLITTQLYPKTRIFTPRGVELDRTALTLERRVLVDGILALAQDSADNNILRSALIIAGSDTEDDGRESLEGELLSIDEMTLTIATDIGDRCVLASEAVILEVSTEGDGFETMEIDLGDLQSGQQLDIFGTEDSGGCFDAEVVIAQPLEEP